MPDFRFMIPIKLEDLAENSGQFDVYSIKIEYTPREIAHKLNDCNENLKSNGIHFILEDFDVFYSCLKHFSSLEQKQRELSWKILNRSLNKLYTDLESFLNESNAHNNPLVNERNTYCNLLKMIVYVFCALSEMFEEMDIKQASSIDFDNINKKGKKQSKRTEESYDWQQNKDKGMSVLLRLFSLPIHRVFNPPVVEDEFVNVITKCCYKMIENPILSRQKDSNLVSNIFHIIGSAIEKHRQSLGFCLKLIQLLQHKEQLVSILANLVEVIVKKHNQKILISEIVREIKRIDIKELSRDSSGPKAISTFLVEVSEKCPQELLPSISDLLDFLEEDSYLMRNATLSIIGIIVTKELSKEGSKERKLRDELLDKLEAHILDNTSYTRSRALLVWCNLCQSEVIPLPRLETLIEAIIGRLKDKSCFVRKYAIQFLNQFLTKNPFAAKLPLQLLQNMHRKEEEKLKNIIALAAEKEQQEIKDMVGKASSSFSAHLAKIWDSIELEFIEFWRELETTTPSSDDSEDEDEVQSRTFMSECSDVEEVFNKFRSFIADKKFKSALSLLKLIKDQWPQNEFICVPNNDQIDEEEEEADKTIVENIDEETETPKPPLPETIALAKRVFLASQINKEQSMIDLGSKTVERDLEKLTTVLIRDEQQSRATATTTTISMARLSSADDSIVNDISKQQILVKYLSDCVKFTQQIQIAIPLVCDLLLSRNITDVQEAIEFFVSAFKFGVQDAIVGVRKLILLIWSQEKTLKDAAVSAYKRIYLDFENDGRLSDASEKVKAFSVVKSLSELVMGATLGELISIEQLLKEFMNSSEINQIHIQVLWERFAMKLSNTTPEESIAAIQLIGMLATSNADLIRTEKNLNAIIDIGLGERARENSRLVSETCIALGKAFRLPKAETCELFFRLPKDHILFQKLTSLLINGLNNINDNYYNNMCDEIVKVIFQLAENPDLICEHLVREMVQKLITLSQTEESTPEMQTDSIEDQPNEKENETKTLSEETTETCSQSKDAKLVSQSIRAMRTINPEMLSRLLALIGDVALNTLIHLDLNVLTELKIRNYIKEEKDKKKDKTPRRRSKTPGRTPNTVGGDQNLEEEIGLAGANAVEDQEQEFLTNICNNEIVLGNNLLAKLSELIVTIARDPKTYPDVKLRSSACLALAKYMAVSENFCRVNLRLLVTIMEKSDEPIIRANTIIALGDLCVRFPNLLDQWSTHMFKGLSDEDVSVKMNTLKVLSRLILSDMVKVKGQISEIAVLMVDENEILSSSSRLFFSELGKKQNAIYNVLPDIISHLSDTQNGLEEEDFRTVMKFIFDLIDKNRQTVCLVEKLCQRFRSTTDERQWRDLAYCLSLLNYSERSIQKLYENLICIADKLFCDFVHECILSVIASSRKIQNIRNETKQMIDEFEQKVEECRNKGVNEDDSEFQRVVGTPPSASKRTAKLTSVHKKTSLNSMRKTRPTKQTKPKRKVSARKSDEEESDEDVTTFKKRASDRKTDRPARAVRKIQPIVYSSDEENSA